MKICERCNGVGAGTARAQACALAPAILRAASPHRFCRPRKGRFDARFSESGFSATGWKKAWDYPVVTAEVGGMKGKVDRGGSKISGRGRRGDGLTKIKSLYRVVVEKSPARRALRSI